MKLLLFVSLLLIVVFVSARDENILQIEDFTGKTETLSEDDAETEDLSSIAKCQSIYGNFCGPGWCGNKWWNGCHGNSRPVAECDRNMDARDPVDECCRVHDGCCVNARKSDPPVGECACDQGIISCLSGASCRGSLKCMFAKNLMITFFKGRSKVSKSCC